MLAFRLNVRLELVLVDLRAIEADPFILFFFILQFNAVAGLALSIVYALF